MGHVISNSKNRLYLGSRKSENPKIIILDFLRGFFLRYKKKILNVKEFYRNRFVSFYFVLRFLSHFFLLLFFYRK